MPSFTYFEPASLAEALSLLGTYGEEARIIAGGQSLLILMRQGLIRPQGLISLHRIPELQEIKSAEKIIALGAMSTQREISLDDGIRARLPALAEAASRVGSIHVQNLGTVGGNISHAEPNGDSAPALICLGASVLAASRHGERMIPLDDFFRGPFENCLEPDEMVVRIHVPLPANGASSVYVKYVQRAVDRATVGIGVQLSMDEGCVCREARIGVGGAAPAPFRATEAEALLKGEKMSDALIEAVGAEVSAMCDPLSDSHGPAEYKRKMAGVFAKRAIRALLSSNGAGSSKQVPDNECEISVNGRRCKVQMDPSTLLLDLLRDTLGLTGTKRGCETGYCGCCTVLIDGKAIHSCSMLAVRAKDHEILTIEGMERDGKLHPLQQAFLELNAAQCGYCSPGMIMSARALLDSNPAPTRAEVSRALSGNLCRCTGYLPIIEAVLHASHRIR